MRANGLEINPNNNTIMSCYSILQSFDYHENPLFRVDAERVFSKADNLYIQSLVSDIDNLIERSAGESGQLARALCKQQIRSNIANIRSLIYERTVPRSLLRLSLDASLDFGSSFTRRLLREQELRSRSKKRLTPPKTIEACRHMLENGYSECAIPITNAFTDYRDKQLEEARAMYAGRNDWRGIHWQGYRSNEGCKSILDFIAKNDIIEMVSEYKGTDMELRYIGWDYSHHRQTWFKNVIGAEESSATNYYHMDAEPDMVKMMVYLTDVGESDGPFRYVRGSHRLKRSLFSFGLHLGVDRRVNPLIKGPSGHFNQNLFRNGRSLLMQFPACFIGSTHFGDHLIEGSDLSRYLLENTITFTRSAGSCIVFDGFLGVHAGGNPLSGERLAVQIGFARRRSRREKAVELAKRNIVKVSCLVRKVTRSSSKT